MRPKTPQRLLRLVAALILLLWAAAVASAGAQRFDHGLLWRVEAPEAPASYLFGTLHASDDRVVEVPAPVRKAFDAARVVAIELVDDEDAGRRFRRAMVMREPRLPQMLGATDFARVDALLAEAGIPDKARARFKPWAALLILGEPRGATGPRLDDVLLAEARGAGKTIHPLESVDEQIDAFDGLPPDTQLALLRHAEARQSAIQDTVEPLVEAYLARDLGKMFRLNARAMAGDAAIARHNALFLDRVLYDRNERFAQRLGPLLYQGRLFGMFGALHLYGERGVLRLLEKRGFRVTRVY